MSEKKYSIELGGHKLTVWFPGLAEQASGEVWLQYGGTVLLATACMSKSIRDGIDYMPLSVEYEERFYAVGEIRTSRFLKREGRPSDDAILSARLIDRVIRPRFPKGLRNDVQIVLTTLSFDKENDPDVLGIVAASLALATSPIPWAGPVAGLRIGLTDEGFRINPAMSERQNASLELTVGATRDRISMLEAGAKEIPEEKFLEAVRAAFPELQRLIAFQEEIINDLKPVKAEPSLETPDENLRGSLRDFLGTRLEEALFEQTAKQQRMNATQQLKQETSLYFTEHHNAAVAKRVMVLFEEEIDFLVHDKLLREGKRPDGRAHNELRALSAAVAVLPQTHGSGLFIRGSTKALSVLTLGAPGLAQTVETMEGSSEKRFMHHYNFPPFSVGETTPFRGPGRREIGHGALAERAIEAILPPQDDFPYAIRVVSEILSSNGSSSMASVCGTSLALMDGGVPITRPAAGIALGLMTDKDGKYSILTDIQGPEDYHGDMDLKVAGTTEGITAMQMDVKIEGITAEILGEALTQAREARLQILERLAATIPEPRPELSPLAPRVHVMHINPDRIRDVIGPGGKVINAIIAETGVAIDIEDSGRIFITAKNPDSAEKAITWITNLTREIKAGELFEGPVTRLFPFGAMVQILPGQEGLVHISEFGLPREKRLEHILEPGTTLAVKVREIDPQGRINLSLQNPPKSAQGSSNEPQDFGAARSHRPNQQRSGFHR